MRHSFRSVVGTRPLVVRALVALGALGIAAALGAAPPATMKAVRMHEFGDASVLRYEDVPVPAPAKGEVLVRVKAAGVNPVDWKVRGGMMKGRATLPLIAGYDVAGVVESLGEGVTEWKVGDSVAAYLAIPKGGGYAEYVAVPAAHLAKSATTIDHVKAAAVPLAALTAWQALFDTAGLTKGQTVLIHAGAGGVGHFAVQLAKAKGAKVIATASGANVEFVKGLGADQVIDYKTQAFETVVKDVDVVLDMIGGQTMERSIGVLKEGGFLVSIVAPPPQEKLAAKKAKGAVIMVQPNGAELAQIMAMIEAGTVKPTVSATYPLADAAKAQEKSKAGVERGKIVLTVP